MSRAILRNCRVALSNLRVNGPTATASTAASTTAAAAAAAALVPIPCCSSSPSPPPPLPLPLFTGGSSQHHGRSRRQQLTAVAYRASREI